MSSPLSQRPPIPIDLPKSMDFNSERADSDYEIVRARSRFEDAQLALQRRDKVTARRAIEAILELNESYADAWLFLAGLAINAAEQREFLEHALALDPHNSLAQQALARLDGRLQERTLPSAGLEEGQVALQKLACPRCGGRLVYEPESETTHCDFCGYQVLDVGDMQRSGQQTTLAVGLLKRKQQAARWNVGEHWLRCESCGAVSTLNSRTLTDTCRFCDSTHVLVEDVYLRFEQPDLIVPLRVNEANARAAIDHELRGGLRALTRFFASAVEQVELRAVYLPFWAFDAEMAVHWSWSNAPDKGQHPVLLGDVVYLAASVPSRQLLDKIEPYDLRSGVDYDPRLLATISAGLYDLEIDRAAIEVRGKLSQMAQRQARASLEAHRPAQGYRDSSNPGRLNMYATAQFMTYRFVLLPVWLGRLVEEDGDARQVAVNGQTAKVAWGASKKGA